MPSQKSGFIQLKTIGLYSDQTDYHRRGNSKLSEGVVQCSPQVGLIIITGLVVIHLG